MPGNQSGLLSGVVKANITRASGGVGVVPAKPLPREGKNRKGAARIPAFSSSRRHLLAQPLVIKPRGKRILVVDDDPSIQRILRKHLQVNNYDVLVAADGEQALEMMRLDQPDLILLDLWLPGEVDGMIVCQRVRAWSRKIPIIILSARTEERQKVQALDLGADDYLTKPFSSDELLARVRACLRRAEDTSETVSQDQRPEILVTEDGYLSMNVLRRQVRAGELDVKLTPTEFELLLQLMLHAGKVLTHRNLLRLVWGPEYGDEADYLRVYVRQLRKKVEENPSQPQYIMTEPGVGYVFRHQVLTEVERRTGPGTATLQPAVEDENREV